MRSLAAAARNSEFASRAHRLTSRGTEFALSTEEQHRIRVANLIAWIGCASYGSFAVGYAAFGLRRFWAGVVVNVCATLSALAIAALIARGRSVLGRYLVLLTANAHMFLVTRLLGHDVGFHYYFIIFAVFPFLLLPETARRAQAFFTLLSVALFLVVEENLGGAAPWVVISPAAARVLNGLTAVLVFGTIVGIVAMFTLDISQAEQNLEARNRFIRSVFGRYLTDEVVANLLGTPEGLVLGGSRRKVTVLMSDLRGFTAMCESLEPERVVSLLNRYLGKMADLITEHHGTIDEFIGDAILAIFGAPLAREDDAERAVACAIAMQEAMEEFNEASVATGLPRLEMGIGLHTCDVVVGNIGSEKRAKYGIVGSGVNLTGRIESYTTGGQILASEAVEKELAGGLRSRGEVTMAAKGFRGAARLLDVLGIATARYTRMLTVVEDVPRALAEPALVECTVLEGKHAGKGEPFRGRIVGLAERSAEVVLDRSLAATTNLSMRIVDHESGEATGEPFYGKASADVAAGGEGRIALTSVPESVMKRLRGE